MFFGQIIGGWEIVLLLVVLLFLVIAKNLPRLFQGLGRGMDELGKATDEIVRELRGEQSGKPRSFFSVRLFVAQGFGVGRIRFAPGTFGSLVGLIWFAMLAATGNFWAYLAGAIEGIAFSIWLCDDAEKILGETDPGSIVLDEIIAIPFCFLPWMAFAWGRDHSLPEMSELFSGRGFWMTVGGLALFRLFDIWKPWPVRQVQHLPGGWGVTADDLLAAAYVGAISIPFVK
jgi:phosphatidylglycerophosphatase A